MSKKENQECNHGEEGKESTYLPALSPPGHEVYMCECGRLFDLGYDAENDMTAKQVNDIAEEIFRLGKKELVREIHAVLCGVEP